MVRKDFFNCYSQFVRITQIMAITLLIQQLSAFYFVFKFINNKYIAENKFLCNR
jgi:hypothetical protein